jgi:hypothetical protein
MATHKKYPDELRERAVKMVFEIREREGKGRGELARVARRPPPRPARRGRHLVRGACGAGSAAIRDAAGRGRRSRHRAGKAAREVLGNARD